MQYFACDLNALGAGLFQGFSATNDLVRVASLAIQQTKNGGPKAAQKNPPGDGGVEVNRPKGFGRHAAYMALFCAASIRE